MENKILYLSSEIISDNIHRDSKGLLVLRNVPITRDGEITYLAKEIGLTDVSPYTQITVFRPKDEVFSDKTIASFETSLICDGHPSERNIDINNADYLMKGYVKKVYRDSTFDDEGNELLTADIVITDKELADEIESGKKREVSIGYKSDLFYDDSRANYLIQKDMRGNHVAVVTRGRAGSAIIHDAVDITEIVLEDTNESKEGSTMEHKFFYTDKETNERKDFIVRNVEDYETAKQYATDFVASQTKKEDK